MKIFATNRTDNKQGFYRIIQPLRFLKRSGWGARTIPFSGKNNVSVLPINDSLLVRLSDKSDFILTTIILDEKELLRILNLRKHNNAKWIVDVSENIYADPNLEPYLPIIERSLMYADGVTTTSQYNKELYNKINENIYVLPSALDFDIWDNLKPVVSRKIKIGYIASKLGIEQVNPSFKELKKKYDIELLNVWTDEVIGIPKKLAKLGLSIVVFPQLDSNVNRCRDNIDALELLALKVPVVASPTNSYKGLPVLYAKTNFEWYEVLEKLITNKKFRKEMGQIEYDWVKNNADMKKYVGNYQNWLNGLQRKDY
jgi:hypothetical protein